MNTTIHPIHRSVAAVARRAFTLVEILVVITIIIIVVLIAVPAFQAMMYSNARIQAEEGLKTGLALGRDAAIRGSEGQDSAALFLYEPGNGMKIVACTKVGTIRDIDLNVGPSAIIDREVFVPVAAFQPVSLPKSWMVRGYAPAGAVDASWYETNGGPTRYTPGEATWVFPESSFFDRELKAPQADPFNRQTFMVRFEGGTGAMSTSSPKAVLVVYPRDSQANRTVANDLRLDRTQDLVRTVRRIMADRTTNGGIATDVVRRSLIGERSGDCLLVKPVSQLALCDENKLAAALGVRVDPVTGSLYINGNVPSFVQPPGGPTGNSGVTSLRIRRWLEGDTNFDGTFSAGGEGGTGNGVTDDPQAKIFVLDRFFGSAQQVALTRQNTSGVNP